VVAARRTGAPELVQFGRQAAGGADHGIGLVAVRCGVAHDADHVGVARQHAGPRQGRRQLADPLAPARGGGSACRSPVGIGLPVAQFGLQGLQRRPCIGDQGRAAALASVGIAHVQAQHRSAEQAARPGGEVLQAAADRDHQVGRARRVVGRRRAGDADRTQVQRMVPVYAALAGLGLGHRDAVVAREPVQRQPRLAVQHAATGDDQWPARSAQQLQGSAQLMLVRPRAPDVQRRRLQERCRAVEGFGLHVLRQRQADRAATGRIEQGGDRAGQRLQDLLGPRDPVEVAGQWPECIVDADVALGGRFELLQHRVGCTRCKRVARQHQQRQAVHMGQRRGGQQVGRARADRRGDGHGALAEQGLAVGDCRMCHRLLVVGTPGRQACAL
jgi:hypothetical protein